MICIRWGGSPVVRWVSRPADDLATQNHHFHVCREKRGDNQVKFPDRDFRGNLFEIIDLGAHLAIAVNFRPNSELMYPRQSFVSGHDFSRAEIAPINSLGL